MTSFKLQCAVLATVSMFSTQAFAAWEALPVAGFTVAGTGAGTHQPTGGTTAYKVCNPTGNYGSSTSSANATCTSPIAPSNMLTSPETGFAIVTSANRSIIMNNALTSNVDKAIGTLVDVVFRNAAKTECIYGTQLSLTNTDYDTTRSGSQTFEVNGIARGGFSASGTVNASYSVIPGTNGSVVYRAGRTFTSVQHRAATGSSALFATGYYNLPLIGGAASIVGDNVGPLSSTPPQTANIDANWVEFTTDANAVDPDGTLNPASSAVYVKAACTAAAPVAVANAIRLRQSWQEQNPPFTTSFQEFVEVRVIGFVPPSGTVSTPVAGSKF